MPIYEYQCERCEERTEAIQKMADDPLTTCEQCGGPLKRLISSPAFQFKGSGWYVTDYARSGSSDGEKSKEETSSKSESKSEGKGKSSDGGTTKSSGSEGKKAANG